MAPGGNALRDEIDTARGQERGQKAPKLHHFRQAKKERKRRGPFSFLRKELSTVVVDEWSSARERQEIGNGKPDMEK